MMVVEICEMFGWTYQEYMNQPLDLIYLIKEKMDIDARQQRKQERKMKS